jgi:hypothetical protein
MKVPIPVGKTKEALPASAGSALAFSTRRR